MKESFISKKFSAASLRMIGIINAILDEYRLQGYKLSLRQTFYQGVARGYIENSVRSYKNLGNLISDARQAGLIDWEMIEDRGRETVSLTHWKNPGHIVASAAAQFRIEKWADQPWHIEVMVEKDALSGVLEPVCKSLDISITANKGYSSSSTMYEIGKRLADKHDDGKKICVLYLGDHDPSGIDMTRDVEERLAMYSCLRPVDIDVVRLALNMDQVKTWNPPENPAKQTDARFASYSVKFGDSSWELDAVEPRTLGSLVRNEVMTRRDEDLWREAMNREDEMKQTLQDFVAEYESENSYDNDEDDED